MDYKSRLAISYYQQVAVINEDHHVSLVQHLENRKFFVKKILTVYSIDVYRRLKENPLPGLPRIFELYEEDGHLTVIEEYISGDTLEELLLAKHSFPEDVAVHYILQLIDILSSLHNLTPPVIHRDIKPSNIMVCPSGQLILLDLNTAKQEDNSKSEDTRLLGTQGYAAQEQYGFGSSTIQTDIFGIGILLNLLLTGDLPNAGLTTGKFSSVIRKCTELRPVDRYPTLAELKNELNILTGLSSEASTNPVSPDLSWLPPGFRTNQGIHMLVASIGYLLLFWFGSTLQVKDVTPKILLIERIFFILLGLALIFFNCNYKNVKALFPFTATCNKPVRFVALTIYNALITFLILLIMIFVEAFFA